MENQSLKSDPGTILMLRDWKNEHNSEKDTKNNQAVRQQKQTNKKNETPKNKRTLFQQPRKKEKNVFEEGAQDQLFQKLLRNCIQ